MVQLVALALDAVCAAIIFWCARAAAKRGFVRTVIQMLAYLAVVLTASFLSEALAPVVYEHIVEPMLLDRIQIAPQERRANAALVSAMQDTPLSSTQLSLELEDVLDSARELVPEMLDPSEMAQDLLQGITQSALRPLIINAISMVGFVILFSLFSILANILLASLGVINHLPVIGPVNALFGCAVGILQGVLFAWVAALLFQGLLYFRPDGWWYFTQEAVDKTFLMQRLLDPQTWRALLAQF